MEPGAQDRQRFFGMRVDDFADLLDRGFAHLAFDAADVDHAFAAAAAIWRARPCRALLLRLGRRVPGAGNWPATGVPEAICTAAGERDRREHARDQRRMTNRPISSAVIDRIAASMILNQ
jgi:hypothetical protein